MKPGQLLFDLANRADTAENRAQPLPELWTVGERQRRAEADPLAAVGFDHRDVDAVKRGAAHQPDRPAHARGVLWPGACAYVR